jgi:hypothetical protein
MNFERDCPELAVKSRLNDHANREQTLKTMIGPLVAVVGLACTVAQVDWRQAFNGAVFCS